MFKTSSPVGAYPCGRPLVAVAHWSQSPIGRSRPLVAVAHWSQLPIGRGRPLVAVAHWSQSPIGRGRPLVAVAHWSRSPVGRIRPLVAVTRWSRSPVGRGRPLVAVTRWSRSPVGRGRPLVAVAHWLRSPYQPVLNTPVSRVARRPDPLCQDIDGEDRQLHHAPPAPGLLPQSVQPLQTHSLHPTGRPLCDATHKIKGPTDSDGHGRTVVRGDGGRSIDPGLDARRRRRGHPAGSHSANRQCPANRGRTDCPHRRPATINPG